MPNLQRDGLFARMAMEHRDEAGVIVFTSQAWRSLFWSSLACSDLFILALGLHTGEVMESPSSARYWRESERMIPGKGDLHDYWRRFTIGRKSRAYISSRQFVGRLAQHFGLLTTEILRGLTVVAPKIQMVDMVELVRLLIYVQLDDTWAWVAIGPKRQPDAAASALTDAEDALIIDEGGQADLAPMLAP
ncbi:hypothetical protein Tco_0434747 [Tanacetum coccineum]